MKKRPKDNTVGPWAAEKLDSLARGLNYWTTYLKNQPYWKKLYIDAFAGPGLSQVRSGTREPDEGSQPVSDLFGAIDGSADPVDAEVTYLKGSPRVALELANPFDQYLFIERDPERVAELEAMKGAFGNARDITIRQGRCEQGAA